MKGLRSVKRTLASLIALSASPSSSAMDIDLSQTSVSGLSSGGYMATQFQLAHAEMVVGAGIIAAGPYYCAQNSISTALAECVQTTTEATNLADLLAYIDVQQAQQKLANDEAIAAQQVLIVHGNKDKRVNRQAVELLVQQYESLGVTTIETELESDFNHVFPTVDSGGNCSVSESPFIAKCDYDAAGNILSAIYGQMSPPTQAKKENLHEISQPDSGTQLASDAFVYVPDACAEEVCRIHVSFHGCNQGREDVGDAYAWQTGFNAWAESNKLVILYPQVKKSKIFPMNPQGCWDWWGYANEAYATKDGIQINAIYTMLNELDTRIKR